MARSVRLALAGEFVPDAVNVQGGAVAEEIRPGLPLAEQLGRIFTALAGGVAARVEVEVLGDIAALDVRVLQLAAMKGIFLDSVAEQVTYVNAPLIARERGVAVSLSTTLECPDWRNLIRLRGTLPDGQVISVSGTLTGLRQAARRSWRSTASRPSSRPADHMMFLSYTDRPGVVGIVGQILGDREINIAGMQVCRDARGGEALIALTVDSAVPADARDEIIAAIGATVARVVDLSSD